MKDNLTQFKGSVLVVEDYPLNAEVIKEMLELMGCSVEIAESGPIALDKLKSTDYHMVFMDVQMPEMDGIQTTAHIRKFEGVKAKIPIIALTANAMQGDREKYMASGMDDFVSKPIKFAELERVLTKFLSVN